MKKISIAFLIFFVIATIYVPSGIFAESPTLSSGQVTRTTESVTVESAHDYSNNYDNTWTITKTGATKIRVYFQYLRTETNYDHVYVYDGSGNLLNTYTGTHDATWSDYSNSETIKVRLKTDYSVTKWGFRITNTEYELGSSGDTTAPTVEITAPSNGATVSGTQTVSCSASDANGISSYAIKIDGVTKSTSSSYSWDTTAYSNAAHTVLCEAKDPSDNTGSASISVTVDNPTQELVLTNGVAANGNLASGADETWHIAVDADALTMHVVLTCGSSDYDFFASHNTATPSHSNKEFEGYTSGGEDVTHNNPAQGTWYINVDAYSGSGDYTLKVTITYDSGSTTNELTNGVAANGNLGSGEDEVWTIDVDADAQSMRVVLTCGSSDYDFFASHNTATPSHSNKEFEGYTSGGEDVTYNNPAQGTWYIDVDVYSGSGDYTLKVTITYGSSSDWGTGGKYAVIWGISDYQSINDLSYCDEDATDVYNYLHGKGYEVKVYGDSHSANYPVWNGLATEGNVRGAIQSLASHAQSGDEVVVWASSHGGALGTYSGGYQSSGSTYTGDDPDNGYSYLLMYDYSSSPSIGTPQSTTDESYSAPEMRSDLEALATGVHVFVGIDACQSGGFGYELSQSSDYSEWYVALTAGVNGYGYDESSHQNGAFTYWFMEQGVVAQGNDNAHAAFQYADSQYNPNNAADTFREYKGYDFNF